MENTTGFCKAVVPAVVAGVVPPIVGGDVPPVDVSNEGFPEGAELGLVVPVTVADDVGVLVTPSTLS